MTKDTKWEKVTDRNNLVLYSTDRSFFVSYNPDTANLFGVLLPLFAGDGNGEETALVKDNKYYILNGDWRDIYESKINEGFDACYKIYKENISNKSSWSN